ncbi:MAG: DUF2399 domain-containing protein [Desulfamplus sp.]|nr:DUF2399 domain-containing protein [Desulfamplus sp.]
MSENGSILLSIDTSWDIIFDARGHFKEPHGGISVPLGTLEVREYIDTFTEGIICNEKEDIVFHLNSSKPSLSFSGHQGKYKNILFIEKEGFDQIIEAARIQDRYDVALMTNKGMSVHAGRDLLDELSTYGIRIFALHDFDIAGFNIARTLKENTKQYQFTNNVEVIDIGLRGEDIEGLEKEIVYYSKKLKDPKQMAIKAGATKEEAAILVQYRDYHKSQWCGERVELNAMTSDQFIDFIEMKLQQHGVKKVVPDHEILEKYYTAFCKSQLMENVVQKLRIELQPIINEFSKKATLTPFEIDTPDNLPELITNEIEGKTLSWVEAIETMVLMEANSLIKKQENLDKLIESTLIKIKEKVTA